MNCNWGAVLRGDEFDLDDWTAGLPNTSDPYIERRDDLIILRSHLFESVSGAFDVRSVALPLIDRLNGMFAAASGCWKVEYDSAVRITDSGHKIYSVAIFESVRSRSKLYAQATTGRLAPAAITTTYQDWSSLAGNEPHIDYALIYYGRARDWFDVYKALEALENYYGGEALFKENLWVEKSQLTRLKHTANALHRHAEGGKHRPPRHPMPFDEAKNLIGQYILRTLRKL